MICVTLGRTRHKHMIAEYEHLASQGIDLVELRLDYIGRSVSLNRLLETRHCPVLITARRREDGGRWNRPEDERLTLLRSAIAAGVDFVDIEGDVASQIPRYGQTKRVISYHDFDETPEDLEAIHDALASEDADIVKLATLATSFEDNCRMMRLVRDAKIPTIGICMGEMGTCTRILASRLGSPFTYAAFGKDKKVAPGMLHWKDMRDLYRVDSISPQTRLFGVVADPVAHSYSPMIHNGSFDEIDLDARYLPFRVPAPELSTFLNACPEIGIEGLSVTIPHKESAVLACDKAESAVTGIGAVNTLAFSQDEVLGYNTDYRAAMDCIGELFEIDKEAAKPLANKRTLILGAGGVARAIAWGLRQRGCDVFIASRNIDRAQNLAVDTECEVVPWSDRHEKEVDLIVNGTPVGMHPDVDRSPYEAKALDESVAVFDTVYNPENTLFIKDARRAGCRIITGIDMFVRQAAYQFKLFTGVDAPADEMRRIIKQATNPVQLQ
ncbi:MAG: shikimate dehydrogenase [Planctomycetota bacterium]